MCFFCLVSGCEPATPGKGPTADAGAACPQSLFLPGEPGSATRDADFVSIDGTGCNLPDLAGRWLLINYWASWCSPCRVEIPELNELHLAEQLVVLGVNYDDLPPAELLAASRDFDIRFIVLQRDPADRLGYARPEVLPTSYLFAPDGSLQHLLTGPQTGSALLALIQEGG